MKHAVKKSLVLTAGVIFLANCSHAPETSKQVEVKSNRSNEVASSTTRSAEGHHTVSGVEADNTEINKRDRKEHEVTADQQKLNHSDTQITARIRRTLVKDKNLSTYAKNVKIITENGNVTLKGPVRTEAEKTQIVKAASNVAGPEFVTDQLQIASE